MEKDKFYLPNSRVVFDLETNPPPNLERTLKIFLHRRWRRYWLRPIIQTIQNVPGNLSSFRLASDYFRFLLRVGIFLEADGVYYFQPLRAVELLASRPSAAPITMLSTESEIADRQPESALFPSLGELQRRHAGLEREAVVGAGELEKLRALIERVAQLKSSVFEAAKKWKEEPSKISELQRQAATLLQAASKLLKTDK